MTCVGPCLPALTFDQLQQTWIQAGGTPSAAPLMAAIALAESRGIPNNANPTDSNGRGGTQFSGGLWQISNGTTTPYANWADPTANAKVAVAKYNGQGLSAWGTYTNGAYKKYLSANGAMAATPALAGMNPPAVTAAAAPAKGGGSNDSDCVFSLPSVGPIGGGCLLKKSQARAVIGAVAIVPAGLLAVLGLLWMTGSDQKATSAIKGFATRGPAGAAVGAAKTSPARGQQARRASLERRSRDATAAGEAAADAAGPFE
jgi:hypothetical protein